jgi:putative ABC transport system ATP-binding protein
LKGDGKMLFEINDLSLVYKSKTEEFFALSNVSFKVDKNTMFGIFGPSGSGKSSLLYVLSGLRKPTSGEIIYKGKSFLKLSDTERNQIRKKEFQFIFQQFFLIPYLNVLENVLVSISISGGNKDVVMEILEKLELKDKIKRFPYELSIGERQRVAVARALVTNAEVIFADEPTASLNTDLGLKVVTLLSEYKKKGTIILITHDNVMIEKCDKIVNLRDGKII